MTKTNSMNPAEKAAESAQESIYKCVDKHKNFLLEAGAGAGKTYSLIKTLKYIIQKYGDDLIRNHQQVACITYTNVATEEIESRTDKHPVILSSTIHSFCWSMIKGFQSQMRERLSQLPKWAERISEAGGIGIRKIEYDLGHPRIKDEIIYLHHNDVISLTVALMDQSKFRTLLSAKYPIVFIDEYQDTNKEFANALITHFLGTEKGPLIGFFGDHWQMIYDDVCGKIDHKNLETINKGANFRSVKIIVEVLNNMRPELPQAVTDPDAVGSVAVYHTENWKGTRLKGQHWGGDLPQDDAHTFLEQLKERLVGEGWDFSPHKTKILMLTHNALAKELGYSKLAGVFPYNDAFIKAEDKYISFFKNILEPVCISYSNKHFGEMFLALGERTPPIQSHSDKIAWVTDMDRLIAIRAQGTIGDVLDHLKQAKHPSLPEEIEQKEKEVEQWKDGSNPDKQASIDQIRQLRLVPYKEVVALCEFVNEKTPFSTKHGVKGAEFENVLIVLGRGWNKYNFGQMLEWENTVIPADKTEAYQRNKNLFYVTCSRPKKRLALLFTQQLSTSALSTLEKWFGGKSIQAL